MKRPGVDPKASPLERLAQQIRTVRLAKGIRSKELAVRLRTARNYVSTLESGQKWPNLSALLEIARALDVEPSELLRVLDARWALEEQWRRERLAAGTMAQCAAPMEAS